MGFVDRIVDNPNRKKFTVIEVIRGNDGIIESLVVEEQRYEGTKHEEGTEIEAITLEAIIQSMINATLS